MPAFVIPGGSKSNFGLSSVGLSQSQSLLVSPHSNRASNFRKCLFRNKSPAHLNDWKKREHTSISTPKMVATDTEKREASTTADDILKQTGDEFTDLCINTVRFLAIDSAENAGSGHPGMPMGMAPTAFTLWDKHLRFNPKNPSFVNRDRFILSAGHGSLLQYSLLHLFGYDSMQIEDLKKYRQFGSKCPGHPEHELVEGVEVTTGPLGQGVGNAVGMAIAEAHMAAVYNKEDIKLIDNYTYCIMGDGCAMEGVSGEASSLAGHLGLGKLILFYDDNQISIDGDTDITLTENVAQRYEAYGWQVLHVDNGNRDVDKVDRAIQEGKKCTDKPTLIIVKTVIGFGAPNKADTAGVHGSALGEEETKATRKHLHWDYAPFEISQKVLKHTRKKIEDGAQVENEWQSRFRNHEEKYPELSARFENIVLKKNLPSGWEQALIDSAKNAEENPTRKTSAAMLGALCPTLTNLIGGSADLATSNKSHMDCTGNFEKGVYKERNICFGVREHAMGAIVNGIALSDYNLIPFYATFLVFTDYMRGALRLASLSKAGIIGVTTHDSVGLGGDGPTHQPIEHLTSLRAMPNHYVYRPADPMETAAAYAVGIVSRETPTTIVLTRQKVPLLENTSYDAAKKGAYIVFADSSPEILLIATGSELSITIEAGKELQSQGTKVRVVSMPCADIFEEQSQEYRESVIPPSIPKRKRVAVEAASKLSWYRYAENFVCIDQFGYSAPGSDVLEHFGMTKDNIVKVVSRI
eukprot:Plantae.Rhodophyta-Hildenbrandia_rubra.ctg51749.p1 GENE.Plantae.Rhodophyta-Hildenbrandia_rubra.ctg51749~~Plantae.Rhodophyta-Hildenbrandia_rubra.ctg51749.p1  ORF type:complete len:751 (-),score=122.57 Plantae.Rhodophyta-Hildenbrandia_rubra.ctg51749:265-2517(-)